MGVIVVSVVLVDKIDCYIVEVIVVDMCNGVIFGCV